MSDDGRFVRRSTGYPGRDRLDASSATFRRAVAALYRESLRDDKLAVDLEPIIAAACAALDELAHRADLVAAKAERNQALVRRKIARVRPMLRNAPAATRPVIERELAALEQLLNGPK